jgi:hypothetical protein
MKDILQKSIETLKEKVRANLLEIQGNQKEIRSLLKQPVSSERSTQLEERYALNKALLAENNDFINVQLTLSNFVEKYSNNEIFSDVLDMVKPVTESEFFEQTVNGKMMFNESHPYFDDDNFFQKLLNYYQSVEDYENCGKLVNCRHKIEKG